MKIVAGDVVVYGEILEEKNESTRKQTVLLDEIGDMHISIQAEMYPGFHTHDYAKPAKLANALRVLEKNLVGDALKRTQWNKTHASQEPGISRTSLNNKIAEFDIQSNNPTSEDGV